MAGAPAGVVIVGGGLAGALLALELRQLGAAVCLIDAVPADGTASATAISYGVIPGWPLAATPLARLAAGASRCWRQLQRRHGPLGWRRCALRLQGPNRGLSALARLGVLPVAQVDTAVLSERLPAALAKAGVERCAARVQAIAPEAGGWRLQLSDGRCRKADQLVLAAGAGCRRLWPALPQSFRSSWAAVLELQAFPAALGVPAAWLPQGFARLALERRAAGLEEPAWVVDPGLVPWGRGALLGQHTWIAPSGAAAGPPPAPWCEQQLRQALAERAVLMVQANAEVAGLHQAAVAFSSNGAPLAGAVDGAPGLWLFTSFSGAFAQVPVLAPLLARCVVQDSQGAQDAERRLQQLGVWPKGADSGN
ncbi:FAD-binding oxidoreductase [Synechococcus sp. HK05]|uniref:FAD-dependent oxidoreductase n=1 Tax=Synechococcus sp. HK05 TaxID=2725975 RepID=UPI001C37FF69|nr:FAD-dependent oxidoreductase [Synechococcus sp. HK05]MBV2352617.1 FAD-binding oxidoreductase [Synechococcus sp. HK05]